MVYISEITLSKQHHRKQLNVYKRFNHFRELYRDLMDAYPLVSLASLPQKGMFSKSNISVENIREKHSLINAFLRSCMEIPIVRKS